MDNGLSDRGKEQSAVLGAYFKINFPDSKPLLLSSAKKDVLRRLGRLLTFLG